MCLVVQEIDVGLTCAADVHNPDMRVGLFRSLLEKWQQSRDKRKVTQVVVKLNLYAIFDLVGPGSDASVAHDNVET